MVLGELVQAGLEQVITDLSDDKPEGIIEFLNLANIDKFPSIKDMNPE